MTKNILLSFDLEEFDIPEEYGQKVPNETKMNVSLEGLKKILMLLDELEIKATFFTTANFALHNKEIVKKASEKHEIASHGLYHSSFSDEDYKKSKIILEKIIHKKISGFRMPRLKKISYSKLRKAGYLYDSSINPTWLPGRYNNFFSKRKVHKIKEIIELPISATPIARFYLFWHTFKNFPELLMKSLYSLNLKIDGYINIYFHPWEFTDIKKYNMPWYIKRISGDKLEKKLKNYIIWFKKRGNFVSFSEFLKTVNL